MDVIVVGAGVVGLAAAWELSQAGHRVRVVSADVPGSRQSAGLSRIFRLAHADGPLTDAAARSLALWNEWERQAKCGLLDRVGLLLTGDMSAREPHLKRHRVLDHMSGASHPLAVAQDHWVVDRAGAAIHAQRTIRFLQTRLDVTLAEVNSVDRGGVRLGDGTRLDSDRVVVCAGPDTYELLGLIAPRRLRSVRFSFALREPLESPAPCWIQRDERLSEPFYAVMDGPDHYSIGLSEAAAVDVLQAAHLRDARRRTVDIVTRVFPGLVPVAERVVACEYATNPGGGQTALAHDGWDIREHDGVLGLTGPSLFKFAPLLGRLAADRLGAGVTKMMHSPIAR